MTITQFTMEEVRCFAGRHQLEIRPLTFLVGENSTGKTTALACFQILSNYLRNREIDFNSHPYSMGIFRDIVRRSRRSEKTFSLGFRFEDGDDDVELRVEFAEREGGLEPVVKSTSVRFVDGEVVFRFRSLEESEMHPEEREIFTVLKLRQNRYRIDVHNPALMDRILPLSLQGFFDDGSSEWMSDDFNDLSKYLEKKFETRKGGLNRAVMDSVSAFSTAPVRARPKRTYDPTREYNDPEGSDVPMRLMRIAGTRRAEWERLKRQLEQFGESSGLFQRIEIKNLGRSMSTPFQLKVKVRGPTANIMDVGYGVSQVLPILEQILNEPFSRRRGAGAEYSCYLLQQPEVHLHPRAQAELSSLLGQLASRGNQSFIIETHSDYLIDRARIDIMQGNINKDDVSLIYFEPKKNVVNVHNISFDEMGNMIGVPPHFRAFFLLESDRLMGFAD